MVTISMVLPMMGLISDICAEVGEEAEHVGALSAMVTRMRGAIVGYLTDKLKERTSKDPTKPGLLFYEKCSFLDPRFKTLYSSPAAVQELEAEAEPRHQTGAYPYCVSVSCIRYTVYYTVWSSVSPDILWY